MIHIIRYGTMGNLIFIDFINTNYYILLFIIYVKAKLRKRLLHTHVRYFILQTYNMANLFQQNTFCGVNFNIRVIYISPNLKIKYNHKRNLRGLGGLSLLKINHSLPKMVCIYPKHLYISQGAYTQYTYSYMQIIIAPPQI
jgi:hypothetical protein